MILAVIDQVLASFDEYPTQGTFILDGQKMGDEAKCIVRFNLEDGFCRPIEDSSDDIAAGAIDAVLAWPESPAYGYRGEAKFFGQLPSGIYQYGRKKALVLNTTFGRFIASFYADFRNGGHDESIALLIALAEAFASMGKEDRILQSSAQRLCDQAVGIGKDALILVKKLFLGCNLPALKTWREWHEPANNSGELTLFFE